MCIADVRTPKFHRSAPWRTKTRSLGIVGGLIHPIGTYSLRSELTFGTAKNGLGGTTVTWKRVGVSASLRVPSLLLLRRNALTAAMRPLTAGIVRSSFGGTFSR